MDRELNPPDEIIRRLIFVIYLAGWLTAVTLLVIGIDRHRFWYVSIGLSIGVLNMFLRRFGKKNLEFNRLAKSFPFGTKEDEVPLQLRAEMQNILQTYQDNNINWRKRQDLREKLTKLVDQEPRILEAYGNQIYAVHPRLKEKQCQTEKKSD
jgi:hypothetical protein